MIGKMIALTEFREEDAINFSRWQWDQGMMSGLSEDIFHPFQEKDWVEMFADTQSNENFYFVIRRLSDDQGVGFISLSNVLVRNRNGEIGLAIIDPDSRQKGYGKEAMELLMTFAFDHIGLHKLYLNVHAFNTSAIGLYKKLGFILEGTHREAVFYKGQWQDQYYYGLLQKEWRNLHSGDRL